MCHTSQGVIFWIIFHTQFQLTISKNSWNRDFELKSYKSYFARKYHLSEISYSISTNIKQKLMKLWFWIEVLCVLFHQRVFFQWNFILISAKNKHKIEKILIWNRSVLCHISQGGIIWMKFRTQFQLTISKNSWNYDFELKSYTSYFLRRYHLNEISY